jgi:octaprenyl-diphosphate synthase
VADDMARVDQTILARAASHVSMIPDIARHLIASGGKRLRPMLTLAAAGLCDYCGATKRACLSGIFCWAKPSR